MAAEDDPEGRRQLIPKTRRKLIEKFIRNGEAWGTILRSARFLSISGSAQVLAIEVKKMERTEPGLPPR